MIMWKECQVTGAKIMSKWQCGKNVRLHGNNNKQTLLSDHAEWMSDYRTQKSLPSDHVERMSGYRTQTIITIWPCGKNVKLQDKKIITKWPYAKNVRLQDTKSWLYGKKIRLQDTKTWPCGKMSGYRTQNHDRVERRPPSLHKKHFPNIMMVVGEIKYCQVIRNAGIFVFLFRKNRFNFRLLESAWLLICT